MKKITRALAGGFLFAALTSSVAASDFLITGSNPSQRLVNAPVITWVQHNPEWYAKALTGVSKPYPFSLLFLENQGNWHTPFVHRGMPPPYDLRGWYQ